jgi:hypothetical protein
MTKPFLHDLEPKQYQRLRAWYLAHLRKAQLTDFDSTLLNPSRLLEADAVNLELYKTELGPEDRDSQRLRSVVNRILLRVEVSGLAVGLIGLAMCTGVFVTFRLTPLPGQPVLLLAVLTLVTWICVKCRKIWHLYRACEIDDKAKLH